MDKYFETLTQEKSAIINFALPFSYLCVHLPRARKGKGRRSH